MNTPILIITFNRPDFLKIVISVLEKIKPKKIYFKIDGPRQGNKNDEEQMKKILSINQMLKILKVRELKSHF